MQFPEFVRLCAYVGAADLTLLAALLCLAAWQGHAERRAERRARAARETARLKVSAYLTVQKGPDRTLFGWELGEEGSFPCAMAEGATP